MGQCQQRKKKHELLSLWPDFSQGAFHVKAWLEKQLPSERPGRKASSWLRVYWSVPGTVGSLTATEQSREKPCGHWEVTQGHKMQSTVVRVGELNCCSSSEFYRLCQRKGGACSEKYGGVLVTWWHFHQWTRSSSLYSWQELYVYKKS